jgi:NAD(P)H-flavin reductase
VVGAGLLLTAVGCGSMPDDGDVREVKASPRFDSQVRVYSVPPRSGARPEEIVEGFVEAMTSDDPGFDTARKYLTREAAKKWNPSEVTTVLSAGPTQKVTAAKHSGETPSYALSGRQIAYLDEQSAYRAAPERYNQSLGLVREKNPDNKQDVGEWRIAAPPKGLVLGESDFQRIFRPVNKYYFASSPGNDDTGQRWLVADPVYVRKRTDPQTRLDPVAQAVKTLMDGPSSWLKSVVSSGFPSDATLKNGVRTLAFGDNNSLTVPLGDKAANVNRKRCRDMAAQLLFTLRDLTPTSRIQQVEIQSADASSLCVLTENQAGAYEPSGASGAPVHQYFLDSRRRLVQMLDQQDGKEAQPVPGALGANGLRLKSAGVSRDERHAAGVADDGHRLLVAPIAANGSAYEVRYRSNATMKEPLSAPSWDGRGDLWFADRNTEDPKLLRSVAGAAAPQEVAVEGLGDGYVDSLRVSSDGVRIALLVADGKGRKTLKIGRVERRGSDEDPEIAIAGLRPAAPQMEEVTAMSWAGHSRLVVVGREAGGVQQMRYVQTDGSSSTAGLLPGANQVTAVAASDSEQLPLLAQSQEDGIVRLPPGANWKTVVQQGAMPFYPG